MIEAIENFITDIFTNEYIDNIRRAFSLFEAFEYQNAYSGMYDAVMDESVSDTVSRAEHFSIELANQLDKIIKQHLIQLVPEATIKDRIIVLDALYRVQHLEEYTVYLSIVSSEQDAVDKMSLILEELTDHDQGYFLTLLQRVDDRAIQLLEKFIELKTTPAHEDYTDPEIINRLKLFNDVIGKNNTGYILIDAGMRLGLPIQLYIPYVQDMVIDDNPEQTAINIMSVLYMSNTPQQDLLAMYRLVGEEFFKSAEQVGKLENLVLNVIVKLDDARKILNEKDRISQKGNPSGTGE